MEVSVRRTSRACTRGCFAKKFYDLPKANLSHTKERLKYGVLPTDGLCRREAAWLISVRRYTG